MELDQLPLMRRTIAGTDLAAGSADIAAARQALALCSIGVLVAGADAPRYTIHYANPAICRITGQADTELLGASCVDLGGAVRDSRLAPALLAACTEAAQQHLTLPCQRGDGAAVWYDITIAPVRGPDGAVGELLCMVEDVTEKRLQKAQLTYLATHDDLTGLANRSLFSERLRQAMLKAQSDDAGVAVLCVALDGFNLVSESLGYVAGDQLLIGVALRLQACARSGDTLARHGGHEFVLTLGGIRDDHEVTALCEQIRAAIGTPFSIAGQNLHAGCSIGIARYPQHSDDAITLLRYANLALAQARGHGGSRHRFFTADMNQRTVDRAQMQAALRVALAEGQFLLHYQPVADVRGGAVCALEALVRWRHPGMGLVAATQFIALAEEAGLTGAIGQWSLQQALTDLRAWRDAGLPRVRIAVNLSPKQFRDPDLAAQIGAALARFDIEAAALSLEITETALMQDPHESDSTLAQLKSLGVGLTLDDFGTGYSSLSHLKRFPFDQLKIDCALVGNIVTGTDDAALVESIISMAHHMGLEVSAEGVETEAQCDFLRRSMCDQIQGYFFAKPVDASATAALLAAGHAMPPHLLRIQKAARTLLLVDDEQNIVNALKRLLRRDDYQILTANSGQEGLDVLAVNAVDVIVSDQRMPGMIGADFLRAAKGLYPDTIRIMLSGYTELQSVTEAVNEGAIFKFLTKPWDDEQLRGHIAAAFKIKEIADDNERLNLELRTANHELAAANRKMEELLRQKQQQITRDEVSLNVARELLQFLPLAVLGLDDDGMVAFINGAADRVFAQTGAILGNEACIVLPELFPDGAVDIGIHVAEIGGRRYNVVAHQMGTSSQSRGSLITLSPAESGL